MPLNKETKPNLRTPPWATPSWATPEEVLSGFLKITQHAMVRRGSLVTTAVCLCLHPSLTHHRSINPFENKVWEIYFIKKCVGSFIEFRKLCLIMFPLIFVYVCGYTTIVFKKQFFLMIRLNPHHFFHIEYEIWKTWRFCFSLMKLFGCVLRYINLCS